MQVFYNTDMQYHSYKDIISVIRFNRKLHRMHHYIPARSITGKLSNKY